MKFAALLIVAVSLIGSFANAKSGSKSKNLASAVQSCKDKAKSIYGDVTFDQEVKQSEEAGSIRFMMVYQNDEGIDAIMVWKASDGSLKCELQSLQQ